jgi:hypothetical protein
MDAVRAGLIAEDPKTHIITVDENGTPVALCGLGAIIRRLPGQFLTDDPLNCHSCESQLVGSA